MAKAFGSDDDADDARDATAPKNDTMAKRRAKSKSLINNGDMRMSRRLQTSRRKASAMRKV